MLTVLVISAILTINQLHAQEGSDRSLIGSVINITNNTNPIGADVQQMIQATSTTNATSTSPPSISTNTQSRINWGEVCRNPLVDPLIGEACETLTSPDGYALTLDGHRVLKCIGGGVLATLLGRPDLLSLGPSVGCGN
jgi:hypothetical protein